MVSTRKEIDHPIEVEWQTRPYRVHKYWGRKSPNVISEYIHNYTSEGDIVLDPYVGSGTTAYEAIKARRKVIAFDTNPVATFITKCMLEPINSFDYEIAFEQIENDVKNKIEELYFTQCSLCGKQATIREVIWQREETKEIPLQITYTCSCSQKILVKKEKEIDIYDREALSSIDQRPIPFWYPPSIDVPRYVKIHKPSSDAKRDIHEFFSNRSIIALSYLKTAIENLDDESLKRMMLYAFSASLPQSSKLISIKQWRGPNTWKGSSWIVPGLYVLKNHCERNVWYNFEVKFRRILSTKTQDFEDLIYYKPANSYKDIMEGNGTAWIETRSAGDMDDIPDNGIDLVLTDPPYHEDILYTDQSVLFASWLHMNDELNKGRDSELTLNTRATKNRPQNYYESIQKQFTCIQKKVVPKGKIIVAFESNRPKEWDRLIKSMLNSKMKCERIVFQPQRGSFGKAFRYSHIDEESEKKAATLGAYFVRLVPDRNNTPKPLQNQNAPYEEIHHAIIEILKKRNEPTPLLAILFHLYSDLSKELITSLDKSLVECIESIPDADFIMNSTLVYSKSHQYPTQKSDTSVNSLADRVKERIERIVIREGKPITSTKMSALLVPFFTGAETIDFSYVKEKLEELEDEGFLEEVKEEGHKWRPKTKLVEQNIEHTRMLFYLAKVGDSFGLNVWIGEQHHEKNHGRVYLKDLCTIPQESIVKTKLDQSFIRDIDVVWINGRHPICQFAVQEEYDIIPQDVVQLSHKLREKWPGLHRIMVGSRHLCDTVSTHRGSQTQQGSWDYWDCLTFDNLENYYDQLGEDLSSQLKKDRNKDKEIYQEKVTIIQKEVDYSDKTDINRAKHCTLRFESSKITGKIRPGQFVAVSCSPRNDIKARNIGLPEATDSHSFNMGHHEDLFLLKRPFSVHRIYYEGFNPMFLNKVVDLPAEFLTLIEGGFKDSFDILFKVVGRGTKQLASMQENDKISVLGPLGNGISKVPLDTQLCYLVAGGIGIAPLYAIAEHLRWLGINVKLIVGGEENIPLDFHTAGDKVDPEVESGYADDRVGPLSKEFEMIGCKVNTVLASKGEGTAVEKFQNIIEKDNMAGRLIKERTRIYACGPWGMLKQIAKIAEIEEIECEVLLEKRMACCIGTCLSCVCDTYKKDNNHYTEEVTHKRVCYDGPVFNSKEIKWS